MVARNHAASVYILESSRKRNIIKENIYDGVHF